MQWNRESVAAAIAGAGGAWMLGSVWLRPRTQHQTPAQRRGLSLSGGGFLLIASAGRRMQGFGNIGVACSLLGTAIAMAGMYQLLRERAALRDAALVREHTPDSRD